MAKREETSKYTFVCSYVSNTIEFFVQPLNPWIPHNYWVQHLPFAPLVSHAVNSTYTVHYPFHFLDLLTELRMEIYEYFVLVGKIFYSPEGYCVANESRYEDWKAYRIPSLQILRVCKQIQDEAEEIYLSKNLFVIPDLFHFGQPFSLTHEDHTDPNYTAISHEYRWLFSDRGLDLIRNVSVSFNARLDLPLGMDYAAWCSADEEHEIMDVAARQQYAHEFGQDRLAESWDMMTSALHSFQKSLCFLEIDYTNAYCITGCCRMLSGGHGLPRLVKAETVVLLGLRGNDEAEEYVCGARVCSMTTGDYVEEIDNDTMIKRHSIVFNPETDIWAKWKNERKQMTRLRVVWLERGRQSSHMPKRSVS